MSASSQNEAEESDESSGDEGAGRKERRTTRNDREVARIKVAARLLIGETRERARSGAAWHACSDQSEHLHPLSVDRGTPQRLRPRHGRRQVPTREQSTCATRVGGPGAYAHLWPRQRCCCAFRTLLSAAQLEARLMAPLAALGGVLPTDRWAGSSVVLPLRRGVRNNKNRRGSLMRPCTGARAAKRMQWRAGPFGISRKPISPSPTCSCCTTVSPTRRPAGISV